MPVEAKVVYQNEDSGYTSYAPEAIQFESGCSLRLQDNQDGFGNSEDADIAVGQGVLDQTPTMCRVRCANISVAAESMQSKW